MPMEENISRSGGNTAAGGNHEAGRLHKRAGVGGTVWWGWPGGTAQGSWQAEVPRGPAVHQESAWLGQT